MAVTMEQVLAVLHPDEPDYNAAAALGPEALPHLEQIIQNRDVSLAPNAAYLVSLIPGDRAHEILANASRSPEVLVRLAAAGGAQNLPEPVASNLISQLLDDPDDGVRKVAIDSVQAVATPQLREKLLKLATCDPAQYLREAASTALSRQVNPTLFADCPEPCEKATAKDRFDYAYKSLVDNYNKYIGNVFKTMVLLVIVIVWIMTNAATRDFLTRNDLPRGVFLIVIVVMWVMHVYSLIENYVESQRIAGLIERVDYIEPHYFERYKVKIYIVTGSIVLNTLLFILLFSIVYLSGEPVSRP